MASTYLSRTNGTPTDLKIQTYSAWVKRSGLSSTNYRLFGGYDGSSSFSGEINFNSNQLRMEFGGGSQYEIKTNAVYRDTSAWYHIVVSVDTTQATASDRVKFYVNGEQVTSFASANYPSQNATSLIGISGRSFVVGAGWSGGEPFDGSMAHVHFIDGTAYDADTFGETDATTGIWKPKTAPSVTYGTNGFFLKFENSGAFGTDSSGNGNNFTVNGTMTQTLDTPSNVFNTMNPLDNASGSCSYSNGNLTVTTASVAGWRHSHGCLGVTKGKWYYEAKVGVTDGDTGYAVGWCDQMNNTDDNINSGTPLHKFYAFQNGTLYNNDDGSPSQPYMTTVADDIIMIALDLDNNKGWVGKNGTWYNNNNSASTIDQSNPDWSSITLDTSSGASGVYVPVICSYNDGVVKANFGNGYFGTTQVSSAQNPDDGIGIFEYDVPTGYRALCTKSINAEEYS